MNDYDRTARRAAKLDPLGFFRWLLTAFHKHLRFERWLDTRTVPFPGDPERIGDTVAELAALDEASPPWALPVEFQAEPDPDMFGRLLIFLGMIWLQLRPDQLRGSRYQLAAAVVNLTGTPSSTPASRDYVLPGPDGVRFGLVVRELYLSKESAAELLEKIAKGELPRAHLVWIPLMQTDDPSGIIVRWVELAFAEPDDRLRGEYGALAKVFAKLSPAKDQWFQALEGWNMKTSPFLDEIRAEGRSEGEKEGRKEGRKEGQKEGRKEGLKEGRTEGSAKAIVKVLQLRFKQIPPPEIVARLHASQDENRLSAWLEAAVTTNTLEEFLAEAAKD